MLITHLAEARDMAKGKGKEDPGIMECSRTLPRSSQALTKINEAPVITVVDLATSQCSVLLSRYVNRSYW
jgi:hypothetical protein